MDEKTSKVLEMFFPYAQRMRQAAYKENKRFVHYTSSEAAMSILSKSEVWMRNATCMNDYLEVSYGISCLCHAYNDTSVGYELKTILNDCFSGVSKEIEVLFNSWIDEMKFNSYLTCISEHLESEDRLGRLSMWRAYGKGSGGVALVFFNGPFLRDSNALKAYTSPVAYMDFSKAEENLGEIVKNIREAQDLLLSFDRQGIKQTFFEVFKNAVLCTKHLGFAEEKEWRVVYTPTFQDSSRLIPSIELINGIPQQIYKISLKNLPDENFYGVTIPELLDRIIIGPTQYPMAMYQAFVKLLETAGVQNAKNKVIVSDIPLRV